MSIGGDTADFITGAHTLGAEELFGEDTANFLGDPLDLLGGNARRSAEEAAAEQEEAFGQGIGEQRRQFDLLFGLSQPAIEAGDMARQQQLAILGLLGPEAQAAAQAQIQESPAQKFIRDRQQRALLRNSAATGQLGGGNIQTALQQQAAGFAQQDIQNQFNRLASVTGGGQVGVGNVGQFGQAATQNITNLLGQQGNAAASGILGAQQAQAQTNQNLIGLGAAIFSDESLKTDIKKIGRLGKLDLFSWVWKDTGLEDKGFIAQQVQKIFPEHVINNNGLLMVDYDSVIEAA